MTTEPAPGDRLPPDNHVHTQFSYDADNGSMIESCRQAVKLGLPSIAFTEHIDTTPWAFPAAAVEDFPEHLKHRFDPPPGEALDAAGHAHFHAPELDVDGYFESIEQCRAQFGSLRILTGLEIGEPHWFPERTAEILAKGPFERILGSLHSLTVDGQPRLIDELFRSEEFSPEAEAAAVTEYLAEAVTMIETEDRFQVFAHIDYLVRQIERLGRRHDPRPFEEQYRETLRALARAERILEINTRLTLDPLIVAWWYDVGGQAVSFGSDAHSGPAVGTGFAKAAAMAEANGFRRQEDPQDFWRR
jgi:histidinol-phosphatase (PHP family)